MRMSGGIALLQVRIKAKERNANQSDDDQNTMNGQRDGCVGRGSYLINPRQEQRRHQEQPGFLPLGMPDRLIAMRANENSAAQIPAPATIDHPEL